MRNAAAEPVATSPKKDAGLDTGAADTVRDTVRDTVKDTGAQDTGVGGGLLFFRKQMFISLFIGLRSAINLLLTRTSNHKPNVLLTSLRSVTVTVFVNEKLFQLIPYDHNTEITVR